MAPPTERPVAAIVLCAGLGTRLRPLTDLVAKPLVPIGDRPALAHVLDHLAASGAVTAVAVNAHHRARDVERFVAARGEGVALSREDELLGTAGGVARAAARGLLGASDEDVLVWNGDILCALEVRGLVRAARAASAGGAEATLAVTPPRAASEGNVGLDAGGRVVRLRRETTAPGEVAGAWFLGVHVLGGALRAALPAKGCLVGDVYLPALRRGAKLSARVVEESFVDVGSLADYLRANVAWLAGRRAWVASSASVDAGVDLDLAVVGEGACVEGEGQVARAVVWPGCALRAPATDVVVTPAGAIAVGLQSSP